MLCVNTAICTLKTITIFHELYTCSFIQGNMSEVNGLYNSGYCSESGIYTLFTAKYTPTHLHSSYIREEYISEWNIHYIFMVNMLWNACNCALLGTTIYNLSKYECFEITLCYVLIFFACDVVWIHEQVHYIEMEQIMKFIHNTIISGK